MEKWFPKAEEKLQDSTISSIINGSILVPENGLSEKKALIRYKPGSGAKIYLLSIDATYIEILQQQNDVFDCILVVGHNPGIEELSHRLTRQAESFPTCTLAEIKVGVEQWGDVSLKTQCTLRNIWRPRELED